MNETLVTILLVVLSLVTTLGLVMTVRNWNNTEARKTWLTVLIGGGVLTLLLRVLLIKIAFVNTAGQMENTVMSIERSINKISESKKKPEKKVNTYYINRLKALTPDSLKSQAPAEFFTYFGKEHAWRYPMVYPYTVCSSTMQGNCWLAYEPLGDVSSQTMPNIARFNFDKNMVIAMVCTEKDTGYAIFRLWKEKKQTFTTLKSMFSNAHALQYKGPDTLMTFAQYSNLFVE